MMFSINFMPQFPREIMLIDLENVRNKRVNENCLYVWNVNKFRIIGNLVRASKY